MRKSAVLAVVLLASACLPCLAGGNTASRAKNTLGLTANLGASVAGGYLFYAGLVLAPEAAPLTALGAVVFLRGSYGTAISGLNLWDGGERPSSLLQKTAAVTFPGSEAAKDIASGIDIAFDVAVIWATPAIGWAGRVFRVWPDGRLWASALGRVSANAYEFGWVSNLIGYLDIGGNTSEIVLRRAGTRENRRSPAGSRPRVPSNKPQPLQTPRFQPAQAQSFVPQTATMPQTATVYVPQTASMPQTMTATARAAATASPNSSGSSCGSGYHRNSTDGTCDENQPRGSAGGANVPAGAPQPTTWEPGVDVRSR